VHVRCGLFEGPLLEVLVASLGLERVYLKSVLRRNLCGMGVRVADRKVVGVGMGPWSFGGWLGDSNVPARRMEGPECAPKQPRTQDWDHCHIPTMMGINCCLAQLPGE